MKYFQLSIIIKLLYSYIHKSTIRNLLYRINLKFQYQTFIQLQINFSGINYY